MCIYVYINTHTHMKQISPSLSLSMYTYIYIYICIHTCSLVDPSCARSTAPASGTFVGIAVAV